MLQATDVQVIFLQALANGLMRVRLQGPISRINLATPLIDGMVVSRRVLGILVRQTALNMGRRKRLDNDRYDNINNKKYTFATYSVNYILLYIVFVIEIFLSFYMSIIFLYEFLFWIKYINICFSYHPPHVRRRLKIQEMVQKYKRNLTEPELLTLLFSSTQTYPT